MDNNTKKWVSIGAVAGAVIVMGMWYKKYRDNQKVADLKAAQLAAASTTTTTTTPSTITPASIALQTFIAQPMADFISQPLF